MKILAKLALLWPLMMTACAVNDGSREPQAGVREHEIIEIKLPERLMTPDAEYSGLAWCDNSLILLPQYPQVMCEKADGCLYQIPEAELESFLSGGKEVMVREITLNESGMRSKMVGFEGYEAIDCDGSAIYLSVEARVEAGMQAYLLKGKFDAAAGTITLEADKLAIMLPQTDRPNASYEALFFKDNVIYAFYEHYNKLMNPHGYVYRFDADLHELDKIPAFDLWYRLTDIGGFDEHGRLWALNYNYPGSAHESEVNPLFDPLTKKYGPGRTHLTKKQVERLIPLKYSRGAISLDDLAPLQLVLGEGASRNWEGLAVWPGKGFLLATDKFPRSILAFIPFDKADNK